MHLHYHNHKVLCSGDSSAQRAPSIENCHSWSSLPADGCHNVSYSRSVWQTRNNTRSSGRHVHYYYCSWALGGVSQHRNDVIFINYTLRPVDRPSNNNGIAIVTKIEKDKFHLITWICLWQMAGILPSWRPTSTHMPHAHSFFVTFCPFAFGMAARPGCYQ